MRALIVNFMLRLLNSRFLNATPCKYGFIGNVDAFSYENLESEARQRPGITVEVILAEADRFRSCPMIDALTVIDGGDFRPATCWDLHELRQLLRGKR